jgi:hypothetical protein
MNLTTLSPSMATRVAQWMRYGHKPDYKLLRECAYYPRGGCQDCAWESPRSECPFSHILIDTRIESPTGTPRVTSQKKEKGTAWGVSLTSLIKRLPPEVGREVEKLFNQYNQKGERR